MLNTINGTSKSPLSHGTGVATDLLSEVAMGHPPAGRPAGPLRLNGFPRAALDGNSRGSADPLPVRCMPS
jgi:hypothetical protein